MNQELLKRVVTYNPKTGRMFWKERPLDLCKNVRAQKVFNALYSGKRVGCLEDGYMKTSIMGGRYQLHRLAWLYVHGHMPKEIDHINGCRCDNSIRNLRDVDRLTNHKNMKRSKANRSGITGVYWNKVMRSWEVRICANNNKYYLGSYKDVVEAIRVRREAERKYGFHENHGKRQ